jgi:hypothetical protein
MKLAAVRKLALALPDVTEEPHFHLSSFRVRGKIFVTVPPEETHLHVFLDETQREPALALHPEFVEKLWWGGKVRGLRVALADAEPAVVKELLRAAWEAKAPKRRRAPARRSRAGRTGRARTR